MKTALVTGATSGIGHATAIALHQAGYKVIITGRRAEKLNKLATQIGAQALCFDIRDRAQTEAALAGIDHIDVLVNNAGLALGLEHLDQGDVDLWETMIDTNVKGVLYATRCMSPKMIAAGGGHIINIGSIAGRQVYENGAVYCASKHALHALSEGMRIDFLKNNIRVTEVRPGMIETEFSNVRFQGDNQRAQSVYDGITALTPEDIARAIIWIIEQPSHVNINEIEIMPTQQASAYYTDRH